MTKQNVIIRPDGKVEYKDREGLLHICDSWEDYLDRINADVD